MSAEFTIVLKYNVNERDKVQFTKDYIVIREQFSHCVFYTYNRYADKINESRLVCPDFKMPKEKEIRDKVLEMNNIEWLDSWMRQSALYEAKSLIRSRKEIEFEFTEEQLKCCSEEELANLLDKWEEKRYSCIFGGKENFKDYQKGKITKEEWEELRLRDIYVIGEADKIGNRKFRIQSDLKSVLFQLSKERKYLLDIKNIGENIIPVLEIMYNAQQNKECALTYRLTKDEIHITCDSYELYKKIVKYTPKENKVFAVDLNPNYFGYSIVSWINEDSYILHKTGVYSFKEIIDNVKRSIGEERTYWNNRLNSEIYEVSKKMVNTAYYYRCEIFAVEDLNIKSGEKNKGKNYNTLCNNLFHRNFFVNNAAKRCGMKQMKFVKVPPEYSSTIGNLLYRNIDAPDMVLASIEIGRRSVLCKDFMPAQFKSKDTRERIVFPSLNSNKGQLWQSLEELSVDLRPDDWKQLHSYIKKSELAYRVPVDNYLCGFKEFESKGNLVKHFSQDYFSFSQL